MQPKTPSYVGGITVAQLWPAILNRFKITRLSPTQKVIRPQLEQRQTATKTICPCRSRACTRRGFIVSSQQTRALPDAGGAACDTRRGSRLPCCAPTFFLLLSHMFMAPSDCSPGEPRLDYGSMQPWLAAETCCAAFPSRTWVRTSGHRVRVRYCAGGGGTLIITLSKKASTAENVRPLVQFALYKLALRFFWSHTGGFASDTE